MPAGTIFWMLMILWALFGGGYLFAPDTYRRPLFGGFAFLLFVLLFLLGWRVFGFVVQ